MVPVILILVMVFSVGTGFTVGVFNLLDIVHYWWRPTYVGTGLLVILGLWCFGDS